MKENRNVYRGYFPVQPGNLSCKEGFEAGEDVEAQADRDRPPNPLLGTSYYNLFILNYKTSIYETAYNVYKDLLILVNT